MIIRNWNFHSVKELIKEENAGKKSKKISTSSNYGLKASVGVNSSRSSEMKSVGIRSKLDMPMKKDMKIYMLAGKLKLINGICTRILSEFIIPHKY